MTNSAMYVEYYVEICLIAACRESSSRNDVGGEPCPTSFYFWSWYIPVGVGEICGMYPIVLS